MKGLQTDCVHYDFDKHCCKILDKDRCMRCSFYINRVNAVKKRRAANARLRRLPIIQQEYIADKYYDGNAPWATNFVR